MDLLWRRGQSPDLIKGKIITTLGGLLWLEPANTQNTVETALEYAIH